MPGPGPSMREIGERFVEAFNRRDADALVELCDPAIEFHPTALAEGEDTYHGHDGMRRWVRHLNASEIEHRARVREVRPIGETRFLLLSEVLLDGEPISPAAMLARLGEAGTVVEARAYLSDEVMLRRLGLAPEPGVAQSPPPTP